MRWDRSTYSWFLAIATIWSISSGKTRCNGSLGPGVRLAKPCPWRTRCCQRTMRRCSMARIEQLRRAETPWFWEVSITVRISSLVCSLSHWSAIGPTNPHSFFFAGRQFDRQIRQGPFLLLEFVLEGFVDLGADQVLLASRSGAEPVERPFLNLLTDTGQIGRVEAFSAQELAHRFVVVLSFQVNLELLLGAQKPPLLGGALVRSFGCAATVYDSVSVLRRQGQVLAPVALRAPFARTCPSTL